MSNVAWRHWLAGAAAVALFSPGLARAQDETTTPAKVTPTTAAAAPVAPGTAGAGGDKPFTTRLVVDNRTPVSYGEEVVISVWITPHKGLDLKHVKIHPKGALTSIYRSEEQVAADLTDKNQPIEFTSGITCRVGEANHRPGIPFVAVCPLNSRRTGWSKWVDLDTLLDSGRQQVEIEISLQEGLKSSSSYYEFGGVDFVSSKPAVVLGGFFGAFLHFLIAVFALQAGRAPVMASWKAIRVGIAQALPQLTVRMAYGSWNVVRSTLLGGVTAMVVIILAKSSEGFEAPISLRVQDFWGGVVIGLVSVQLSRWVLNRLNAPIP